MTHWLPNIWHTNTHKHAKNRNLTLIQWKKRYSLLYHSDGHFFTLTPRLHNGLQWSWQIHTWLKKAAYARHGDSEIWARDLTVTSPSRYSHLLVLQTLYREPMWTLQRHHFGLSGEGPEHMWCQQDVLIEHRESYFFLMCDESKTTTCEAGLMTLSVATPSLRVMQTCVVNWKMSMNTLLWTLP